MFQKRLISILFVVSFLLPVFPVGAQANGGDLKGAVDWLVNKQADDGGFSNGLAPESDIGATADAVLALVFAGEDPTLIARDDNSPIDFLTEQVHAGNVMGAGSFAKILIAINAAEMDPSSFGGVDLVAAVLDDFDEDSGLFGMGPFDSALAIAALVAVAEELPPAAVDGLLATRLEDGSYSFVVDETLKSGDSNTTALVVQALIAAGVEGELGPSLDYFRAVQNEDKGWTYQKPSEFGEDTDANSTALVIQALVAAGEDLEEWGDPMSTLAALQLESGGFNFNLIFPGENILATIQAIPALAGGTYVEPVGSIEAQGVPVSSIVFGVALILILVLFGLWINARMRIND